MALVSKKIGLYTLNVCADTGFICAKTLVKTYIGTKNEKLFMAELSDKIKKPDFYNQVIVDFDRVVNDGNIDINYIKKIDEQFTSKEYMVPPSIKFNYMIRQTFNNDTRKINTILLHPYTAIKISSLISPSFGVIMNPILLRYLIE